MSDKILRLGSSLQDLLNMVLPFHADTGAQLEGLKSNGEGLMQIVSIVMASVKKLTSENQAVQASLSSVRRTVKETIEDRQCSQ